MLPTAPPLSAASWPVSVSYLEVGSDCYHCNEST